MRKAGILGMMLMTAGMLWADHPIITLNRVQQRYPWNGKVDIDYTVENVPPGSEQDYYIRFKVTENGKTHTIHEIVDYSRLTKGENGSYRVTWDSEAESSEYQFYDQNAVFKGEVVYCAGDQSNMPYGERYVIIDISGGPSASEYPVTYRQLAYQVATNTFNTTEYKTQKLVLREIKAGTFMMGSPTGEYGRKGTESGNAYFGLETQHSVTLTKNYLIGIFPITQAQYRNITGNSPAASGAHNERALENVSYQDIRGSSKGIARPATFGNTDADSFCGKLSAKTGLIFDLPTEAEWEYACRAGTTTSTYAGEMTASNYTTLLGPIAHYGGNQQNDNAPLVGEKLPNAWCLYDMLGSIWQWCRDRTLGPRVDDPGAAPVIDPLRDAGGNVVDHGGAYYSAAGECRAAIRGVNATEPSVRGKAYGFRISARKP